MRKRVLGIILALSMVVGAIHWPMLCSEAADQTTIEIVGENDTVLSTSSIALLKATKGWQQVGFSMSDDFRAALKTGAMLEITFESSNGKMWLVFPDDGNWSRLDNLDYVFKNGKCYVTYEQLAAVLGNDPTTWGDRIQFESGVAVTVSKVRVGQITIPNEEEPTGPQTSIEILNDDGSVKSTESVDLVKGNGWSQAGFDMSADFLAAFKADALLEVTFESSSNKLWVVFPDYSEGWTQLDGLEYVISDNKCYVTYEQIASVLGTDTSKWVKEGYCRIQFSSSAAFTVTQVRIGAIEIPGAEEPEEPIGPQTVIEILNDDGSVKSTEGVDLVKTTSTWSQAGFTMSADFLAAFKEGAVIEITFDSTSENLWLVFPNYKTGWKCLDGFTYVIQDGKCYATYEQIVSDAGDNKSDWGPKIEFRSDAIVSVSKVRIGAIEIPGAEEPDTSTIVLSKAEGGNGGYDIKIADYLTDYESGEEITITGELTSDAWFEIGVGGNVYRGHDQSGMWVTKGFESIDNKLTFIWIGKPQYDAIAIQLWHTNQESTTQEVTLSLESLEVSRNYYDISEYKETNTYPEKEGYVFAGWYADKKCATAIGSDIKEGKYYARFVDEDVLSIKYQLTAGTTVADEDTNLRLITTVDSLMYSSVGFKVDVDGTEVKNVNSNKVWLEITGWCKEEGTIYYTPEESFTSMSKYFMSYEFYGVPVSEFNEKTMVVTPYWITMDGTIVTGTERTITINGEDK